ncbi:MAG: energy transducer TonB [Nitrospiraceae bacterium]
MDSRLRWVIALSFLLHLCLLLAATGLRLPHHGDRPLSSVEISLVTMQQLSAVPSPRAPEHKPPQRVQETPAPPPVPVKVAPTPMPPAKTMAPPEPAATLPPPPPIRGAAMGARRPSGDLMRDLMRDVALPPDAPKFGDMAPARPLSEVVKTDSVKPERSPEKLKKDLETSKEADPLLNKLQKLAVPDMAPVPQPSKEPVKMAQALASRSSLSEELNRELDQELKKIPPPPQTTPAGRESMARPAPPVTARVPTVRTTDLKVPGMGPGSNSYLARVQMIIGSLWSAPPVGDSTGIIAVVIRFRLHRTGAVSSVVIEQSSGNGYFDDAGMRAVLNARSLPSFPPEMTDAYVDAHMSFTVGEQVG